MQVVARGPAHRAEHAIENAAFGGDDGHHRRSFNGRLFRNHCDSDSSRSPDHPGVSNGTVACLPARLDTREKISGWRILHGPDQTRTRSRRCSTKSTSCFISPGKVDRSKLDYRPTPKQRSTIELLKYLSMMGPTIMQVREGRNARPESVDGRRERSGSRDFDQTIAAIAAQKEAYATLLGDMSDADFRAEVNEFNGRQDVARRVHRQPRALRMRGLPHAALPVSQSLRTRGAGDDEPLGRRRRTGRAGGGLRRRAAFQARQIEKGSRTNIRGPAAPPDRRRAIPSARPRNPS